MNISKSTLSTILGISLAALLSNSVLANEKMGSKDQCRHSWGKGGDYAAHFDNRMSALHTALQLTTNQEASWTEFLNKIKPVKMEKPASQDWKNLSTPDRLDRRLNYVKAHEIKMTEHAAAVRAFYDTLTQDQKSVFDKQFQTHHRNS
ncbi:MAG: LTXXQ motif family protein [Candidatus Nitrotoga sp. SPKER]|nr:MAG: LTXXQ motif family protein [Candidatus Nitrotoga sp. SPKER]